MLLRLFKQFLQVPLPDRRDSVSAVTSGFICYRQENVATLFHSFDFPLEDSQFRWID